MRRRFCVFYLAHVALLSGCICSQQAARQLADDAKLATTAARLGEYSQEHMQAWLQAIAAEPHPLGSPAQQKVGDYIIGQALALGARTEVETFTAITPNPVLLGNPAAPAEATLPKSGRNLYAFADLKPQAECVIMLASHYDTKVIADGTYLGANDSGSTSTLLLEMLRRLRAHREQIHLQCDVLMTWFDGEESVLPEWYDGERKHPAKLVDNTYGSRHAAGRLSTCQWRSKAHKCLPTQLGGKPLVALVLIDMLGSPNLQFTKELYSSRNMFDYFLAVLAAQSRLSLLNPEGAEVGDDHLPYIRAGVPAVNIIDFVNTQHWHRPSDVLSQLDHGSLRVAYEVAAATAILAARRPPDQ